MKVRILAAVAALALGTAISGGAAQAATFYLTVDGCSAKCIASPGGNVGYVTVTQDASLTGVLDFSVTLTSGVFNSNGNQNHHALAFDLNSGGLSLSGLQFVNPVSGFALNTSGGNEPPFGSFTDVVDYTGNASQGSAPSTLSFQLKDTLNNLSLSMLGAQSDGTVLAADVFANNTTGNVGALAGGAPGVPEPATWGLMIMGVACVGAAMRMQRRRAFTAA